LRKNKQNDRAYGAMVKTGQQNFSAVTTESSLKHYAIWLF